jgi:hypothetical protein
VTNRKMFPVGLAALLWLPTLAQAADGADEAANQQDAAPAPKCLEAVVNPVTGFAFCTNPRGAPVEPPPKEAYQHPCKPRAHDDDPGTVYEHYSGC